MTRGAVLGLICGACAATSCGSGTSDGCTAGCEKVIACDPRGTLDVCLAQCTTESGNQAMLECLAGVSGCDKASVTPCVDLTVCRQAVKKSNDCVAANGGQPELEYYGPFCSDNTKLVTGKTIPFMSWSRTYLACTIDPQTCRCPGQTWYTDL